MEKILNMLASGVIDGPDDLMGIGECLNLLDDLEGQIGTTGPLAKTIERARLIFKQLILEESPDRSADWLQIQKLLGSLGPLYSGQGAVEEDGAAITGTVSQADDEEDIFASMAKESGNGNGSGEPAGERTG